MIGGGYIGLEAAAVLTKFGKTVTIVEAQDRVWRVSRGSAVEPYEANTVRTVVIVRLNDDRGLYRRGGCGQRCPPGGTAPFCPARWRSSASASCLRFEPLIAAGAAGENGVSIDAQGRTSLPHVYAIGDCAGHANDFADGAVIRLESVQNAHDQATVAARTIMGRDVAYHAVALVLVEPI